MSAESLLSADMGTIGRWLRTGFSWWLAELAALVPARLRRQSRPSRLIGYCDGTGPLVVLDGDRKVVWVADGKPRPLDLAVPASSALVRELDLPAMRESELQQVVMLDADRLFPLPPHQLLIGAVPTGSAVDGRMTTRVAGLPRSIAEQALAAAEAANVAPTRLGLATAPDARKVDFDLTPALRAEGLLPPRDRARTIWWGLVLFAFLLNVVVLVLRDRQRVDRLSALVEEQAPAVQVAQVMLQKISSADRLSRRTVARRRLRDPLADLAAATDALGDGAWVQRYAWDGGTLRLAGYRQPKVDVVAELRRSPRFANVRLSTSDVTAAIAIGQPFDVTADLPGLRR